MKVEKRLTRNHHTLGVRGQKSEISVCYELRQHIHHSHITVVAAGKTRHLATATTSAARSKLLLLRAVGGAK